MGKNKPSVLPELQFALSNEDLLALAQRDLYNLQESAHKESAPPILVVGAERISDLPFLNRSLMHGPSLHPAYLGMILEPMLSPVLTEVDTQRAIELIGLLRDKKK